MLCQTLEVHRPGKSGHQAGFPATGRARHQPELGRGALPVEAVDEESAHGLVAAGNARVIDTGLFKPLLRDLRSHAAAEAVEITIGILSGEFCPGFYALFFYGSRHKLVAQSYRRILTFLFVTGTYRRAFVVGHEGQVYGRRKRAFCELYGRPGIEQGCARQKQLRIVGAVTAAAHR